MHLLYITAALPFGSGETYIIPEVVELQRRGHQVTVVPLRPGRTVVHGDARPLITSTLAKPLISARIVAQALVQVLKNPRLALSAIALLAASRSISVLLKNLAVLPKGLWLAGLVRQKKVDHIHAHFASTNATAAMIASVVSGIPWSLTAHRWDITENNLLATKAKSARFLRAIDVRGGRELASLIGTFGDKVRVIHMGVDVSPRASETVRRSPRPLRVLLGARVDEFKGHRYALEAVAQLKEASVDVMLDCVGEGEMREEFQDAAKALNVSDRVEFPGLRDHQILLKQLRDHEWDVAILPSIESTESREGIPVFLMEAMAAGVAVIGTSTGGIPELLNGGAGILIPQQDARPIAEELTKLANNHELRRQLAEAGVRRVREEFEIKRMVSALLEAVLSGGREI